MPKAGYTRMRTSGLIGGQSEGDTKSLTMGRGLVPCRDGHRASIALRANLIKLLATPAFVSPGRRDRFGRQCIFISGFEGF